MGDALIRRYEFKYDYVDENEYNEIDLLYTADVHGAWVGYHADQANYLTPVFSYSDVNNYRTTLENNNIKSLIVDAGDGSRPCYAYTEYCNSGVCVPANQMNSIDYFASTYGNHEGRWSLNDDMNVETVLNKCNSMCACNMFRDGALMYPAYKTAKIGSKKLAVIGIGYPSANGGGSYNQSTGIGSYSDAFGSYTFYDSTRLFSTVQSYIDYFKNNNFNYIIAVCHMCKSTYESDSRYKARTDTLISNTSGLTAVIQGHYNQATSAETLTDKKGNSVLLCHEAGANLNSFGRLKLPASGTISSYLLDERSDLNVV